MNVNQSILFYRYDFDQNFPCKSFVNHQLDNAQFEHRMSYTYTLRVTQIEVNFKCY